MVVGASAGSDGHGSLREQAFSPDEGSAQVLAIAVPDPVAPIGTSGALRLARMGAAVGARFFIKHAEAAIGDESCPSIGPQNLAPLKSSSSIPTAARVPASTTQGAGANRWARYRLLRSIDEHAPAALPAIFRLRHAQQT